MLFKWNRIFFWIFFKGLNIKWYQRIIFHQNRLEKFVGSAVFAILTGNVIFAFHDQPVLESNHSFKLIRIAKPDNYDCLCCRETECGF